MNKSSIIAVGSIGLLLAGLIAVGQWARHANAERDAGITWTWAYSPRTMQSYLVRAIYNPDGSIQSFALENPQRHTFVGCYPPQSDPENDQKDACTDQLGLVWYLSRD